MNRVPEFNDTDLSIPRLTWGILLISVLSLYLELLFIRWISAEIRIFAYLQNTILIVCFLGLGLGMFTSSKPIRLKYSLIPMLIFLFLLALPATRSVLGSVSEMLSVLGDLVIWENIITTSPLTAVFFVTVGLLITYGLLLLIVDIFTPLGRILGRLMNAHSNPILAYSANIAGSILGTWAFVWFSYFYMPPYVWLLAGGLLLTFFVLRVKHDQRINLALVGMIVLLSWFASQSPDVMETIWSPYQKLDVRASRENEVGEYIVTVNNAGYQGLIDLGLENVRSDPAAFPREMVGLSQYDLPALLHPDPGTMLIVGAGTGNDAAGALRNDVQQIVAVDIDPAIISIGRELHPESPYSNPKVRVVNDDARSFLSNTDEKFDVISFGLLDSHTTTAMTNARLDHYVYTLESIRQARSRLAENGVMVLSFEAQKKFIAERIRLALVEVFDQEPLVFQIPYSSYGWGGVMFVAGDLEGVQQQLDANEDLAAYIKELQESRPLNLGDATRITTDDWPYIYLESPRIPAIYFLLFGIMALIVVRSFRKWDASLSFTVGNAGFWHFAFLGTAFLLLEVQNISKASVSLGNTWQVNAVIITAVLMMALLANWIEYKFPRLPLLPVYFLLIGTSLGLYFMDIASFNHLPYMHRAFVVGGLTSLPMLFSGIVFIRSFAATPDKSNSLGANLIGATFGALLQSITFITGIKALLLVVALFYLLALLTAPHLKESRSLVMQK
jgi:spermidine synthase